MGFLGILIGYNIGAFLNTAFSTYLVLSAKWKMSDEMRLEFD
jgi:hypothetical protein